MILVASIGAVAGCGQDMTGDHADVGKPQHVRDAALPSPDAKLDGSLVVRDGASDGGPSTDSKDASPERRSDAGNPTHKAPYHYRACFLPTGLVRVALLAQSEIRSECVEIVLVQLGSSRPAEDPHRLGSIQVTEGWRLESIVRRADTRDCNASASPPVDAHAVDGEGSLVLVEAPNGDVRLNADLMLDFATDAGPRSPSLYVEDLAVRHDPGECN